MAKDYAKDLFKRFEEALIKIDKQSIEIKELKREISTLKSDHRKEISKFEKEVSTLKKENKRLKEIINKDSSNSSKPPSSNGFKKIINSRVKTDKRPGAQKGHKGRTLNLFCNPTKIVEHKKKCSCGGHVVYTDKYSAKQLVDIEITTHIVEHRAYSGVCSCCGDSVKNKVPGNLKNPVTYGENLKSMATMFTMEGAVSINRTVQMLKELTSGVINLSHGTVVNFTKELSKQLEPVILKIKDKLLASPVNHKDETGIKINDKQHWFHVLSNESVTLYLPHQKRGKDADVDMGILPVYSGSLVHDHFKTLYSFTCDHAECNAHILRYLKAASQNNKRKWASDMISFFVEVHRKRNSLKELEVSSFTESEIKYCFNRFDDIIESGKSEFLMDSSVEKNYNGDDMKLLRRLIKYKREHLRFIEDFQIPFDNNLAERDLRMVKAKTKISGAFRSEDGASNFAIIKSFLSTLRKNNKNIFEGIKLAFLGSLFFYLPLGSE